MPHFIGFIARSACGLTHYASGLAPVPFGGRYVTLAEWWRTGLIAAGANVVVWLGMGAMWLKLLGHC